MSTSMENFGTLEYVLDKYSKTWSWKLTVATCQLAMISKLVPEAWYGENIDEVIIPDSIESVRQLKAMMERYPLEILSKSALAEKSLSKLMLQNHPYLL